MARLVRATPRGTGAGRGGPAEPGHDVYAHAHCYKLTRSVAFVRAQAYDRDRADPIATVQAAFMLNSSANRAPGSNLKPRESHA
jgi:hypothetical protein